ncbi:MAG: chemotaxis protein CheA [Verrucomicrobiota bacterium]
MTPELLKDFYAECDEHLGILRQGIVALEQGLDESVQAAILEKLFRSFHSLKGIVGMVGIRSAEHLAHRTEDYLRELTRRTLSLSSSGMDALAESVQLLEQTVASYRENQPPPEVAQLIALLDSLVPTATQSTEQKSEPKAESPEEALQRKIKDVAAQGFPVWKCTFVPSPALNERGINVNDIRERLSHLGEIVHSAPRIGGGTIAFEFFIALRDAAPDFADWQKDGIKFEQVVAASTVSVRPHAVTPTAPASLFVSPSHVVRVELARLDDLMRIAGELVIQRARLEEQISKFASRSDVDTRGLNEVHLGFGRQFRELRETVMRLRMVPIAEIFDRLPFVIRDLTRGTTKKVALEIRGQQTELDKYVVERLKDPFLHLVRNAVSHGIEDPEERIAAGKPAEATLTLFAKTSGETVIIEIADDGRGIDRAKVAKRAEQMGVTVPSTLDNAAILDLICLPGFSTRDEADRASGRGVGMAVVSNTLRELGGSLFMDAQEGRGTRFTLRLPLTLLITEALIVSSGEQKFAIPQNSVEEVLQIEETNVKRMARVELVSVRGSALPLVRLRELFGFPQSQKPMPSVLVSQTDRGRVGLVVDRIVGQRQVVVRSLRDPLIHVLGIIGATELGDGRPLLILDPLALSRQNNQRARSGASVRDTDEISVTKE